MVVLCPPAWARGTLDDPIVIDAFPYVIKGDTTAGSHDLDGYSCGTRSEAGPERVYRFTLAAPARVTAWVEVAAPAGVDVQLLDGADVASCVARGDVIAEAQLAAGDHFVVVDTSLSDANA